MIDKAVIIYSPVDLWTSPSDQPEPFGPCGQPDGQLQAVAHRLTTLSVFSPTGYTGPTIN